MNVDDIIWHLNNFQNTWNGWNKLITGITEFFSYGNKIEEIGQGFTDATMQLSSVLAWKPVN